MLAMITKFPPVCCSLLTLFLLASCADAQFYDHHPPYQDQHFDLHHTPLHNYGARSIYSDDGSGTTPGANGTETCSACNEGADGWGNSGGGNPLGSRSPICPPVDNANLTLYVQDGLEVEINDQRTNQQTLAGVHRNSRIFLLEALDRYEPSPCTIVVYDCDASGNATSYRFDFSVRAGEHYKVRYRKGLFQQTHPRPDISDMPYMPMDFSYPSQGDGTIDPDTPNDDSAAPDEIPSEFSEIVPIGSAN